MIKLINVSEEMNKFYLKKVVVSKNIIDDLREKKKKNIDRLREGIRKYNEENKTDYKMLENIEQGSVAMNTMVQNEDQDYDLDVAIVFDKDKFNIGTTEAKNIFVEMVKKETASFNKEPEKLTNCIRIYYEIGYHLDFALFRCDGVNYEHCGSEWRDRNPRETNNWFREKNVNNKLRKYTRLLKFFCKSIDYCDMPGGLITTILVEEALRFTTENSLIDKYFISICNYICDKLSVSYEIINPITGKPITFNQSDENKVKNLYNRLKTKIDEYNAMIKNNDTKDKHIDFWEAFFKNDYWESITLENRAGISDEDVYEDNEEKIENFYPIKYSILPINIIIKCQKVLQLGQNPLGLTYENAREDEKFNLSQQKYRMLKFSVEVPSIISAPYKVIWKVKNNGANAFKQNSLRGEIYYSNIRNGADLVTAENANTRYEPISFAGNHYVECYIIKNNVCLAKKRYDVTLIN